MVSLTIPKIFFNAWFMMAIIGVIIVIHYFWGKAPSPPKPSKFFTKHKKTIDKICDVFLICIIVLQLLLLMVFPGISTLNARSESHQLKAELFHFAWASFLISAIGVSGISGTLIGLLSVFQSNLTILKRTFLLIICILPTALSILALLTGSSQEPWSTIRLGLGASFGCWLINGPAIILAKPSLQFWWAVMRALRWVSGDYPA